MVTSTIIFPAAIDVNLSAEQRTDFAETRDRGLYRCRQDNISVDVTATIPPQTPSSPVEIPLDELAVRLTAIQQKDSLRSVALYADSPLITAKWWGYSTWRLARI